MAARAVRLRVTGRVQGVGYRMWAEQTGDRLGLRGWVRNRADGSVEVLAIGAGETVAALVEACRRGPRAAAVTGVEAVEAEDDGSAGFTTRPTV